MVPLGLYVFAGGPIAVSEVFEKSVRAVLGAFENEHGRVELVAEMVVVVVVLVEFESTRSKCKVAGDNSSVVHSWWKTLASPWAFSRRTFES